ncbi:unnamed protein product [Rhizoctonia solani]|uniref:Uncharacterized protein n=1 Tax=Rhizoctonia solani TaxID=456999 RepID=A0A8H3CG27_9AGAM|nr:unnamed protein product [Rhizoctonia solani]
MAASAQATLNISKGSRRRSFLGAAGLVVKPLAEAIGLPGLREPVRAARDIATALKAPKKNDEKAQELIDRIEDILTQIKPLAGGIGCDQYYPVIHMAIGKLEEIKIELANLKSQNYTIRFSRQGDIEQLLSRKEHELQVAIQDICTAPML